MSWTKLRTPALLGALLLAASGPSCGGSQGQTMADGPLVEGEGPGFDPHGPVYPGEDRGALDHVEELAERQPQQGEDDRDGVLRYVDAIVAIEPKAHDQRWVRAVLRYQTGQREAAIADCDFLLEHNPPGLDMSKVRELKRILQKTSK